MATFWFNGSNIVVNGSNEPTDCEDCPCGEPCICCPDLNIPEQICATMTNVNPSIPNVNFPTSFTLTRDLTPPSGYLCYWSLLYTDVEYGISISLGCIYSLELVNSIPTNVPMWEMGISFYYKNTDGDYCCSPNSVFRYSYAQDAPTPDSPITSRRADCDPFTVDSESGWVVPTAGKGALFGDACTIWGLTGSVYGNCGFSGTSFQLVFTECP